MDCLYLHVPKCENEYLPLGQFLNITYMPMGLFALAELTERLGYSTEIIHLGIEWMRNPEYSVLQEFQENNIRAVGMPLYWHYQTYDVLRTAEKIKEVSPDTIIFLGGVTASYFAEEILREFPQIDLVVKGHAESAMPAFLKALESQDPQWQSVPAAVFREGDDIHSNAFIHSDPATLDTLVYGKLPLLRHYETYICYFGFPLAFSKEYQRNEHYQHQTMGRTFFPLFTGRGCPVVCTFCGGNRDTLRRVNGRNQLRWRCHESVLADIEMALEAGYRTMSLCFDPVPERDAYYVTLFEKIRQRRLPVDFYFENWGLPTQRFMDAFAKTFDASHSYMALSPDSGSETIRRFNKGHFYTNAEMEAVLDYAKPLGIQFDIFFTLALPGETLKEAYETKAWITHLRETHSQIRRLMTWTVQLEPGSPQYETPEKFQMSTDRHGVRDYYEAHGGPKADTYSSLGYKIHGYFGDERDEGGIGQFESDVQHLKCMDFCFLSADPRQRVTPLEGRIHCLERRQKIANRRQLTAEQQIISDRHRYGDAAKRMAPRKKVPREEWC